MTSATTAADRRLRDVLLVALTLSAGAIDAISVVGLDKVFSAFMTGNLVFLGVGISGGDGPPTVRVVVALVAFAVGAFAAARFVRPARGDALWPPTITGALVLTAALQSALWMLWLIVSGRPGSASATVLIGIGALAMGVQTTAVFSLGVRAVFTTAATATWTVLMGDVAHWRQSRDERRRLLAVVTAVVVGALLGTLLVRHAREAAPLLPLVLTASVVLVAPRRLHRRPKAAHDDRRQPARAIAG